ncbi:hypothetical protein C1645_838618 [Glomus cerebriforme]|uniref:Uncharacterized protein n=1 Tax=Glomus cerebriforme TaxID=658196 RepID=A0A397S634_9GLOM|nr:hypothetical protein C1645_793010 [Glomus cerebriforme]RIA80479.1 hypothetical protein C1645_838618 [Glomus cerebriforme]
MDINNNIQELNDAIRIELNRQDSVVKQLSKKFGMTEHVIRNMMKEKRPVVKENKNLTAFDVFVEDRKSHGIDNNDDNQLIWDSLSSEQKSSYQLDANRRNIENRYSEVKFIQNSEERLNVLKDGLRELKYQCCRLNQECGWDFLVITIEPKEMPDASFGFGSLLIDDFCIEHPEEVLQLSKKLYQYGETIRNSKMLMEQNENEQIDTGNDRLESLISQTPSLNCQLSFKNEEVITNINNEDNETGSSSSFTKDSCASSEEIDESIEIETDEETDDDDKTVCDDEQDLVDQDPLYELLSQDYNNVQLDDKLQSVVKKFLKARFYADTGKNINIPYKDWKKQAKYSVTGWPKDIKFDDWTRIKVKDKREVYRHLLNVHFHVNENAPEYIRNNSPNKKKRKLAI